jgi:DNA-binding beta-propeller fold protein YncE
VDSNGNVYVADYGNSRVQVFSNTGTFLRKWGTFGWGDGQFSGITGISLDSSGNVNTTEGGLYGNAGRVQVFSNTGTFLRKWGTTGTGDGQFKGLVGIAVSTSGSVYVTDFGNTRVQIFSDTGTFLGKWGVAPSDGGQFEYPEGIAARCM